MVKGQYLYKTLKTPQRGLFDLLVSKAGYQVVVDHTNALHKGPKANCFAFGGKLTLIAMCRRHGISKVSPVQFLDSWFAVANITRKETARQNSSS